MVLTLFLAAKGGQLVLTFFIVQSRLGPLVGLVSGEAVDIAEWV